MLLRSLCVGALVLLSTSLSAEEQKPAAGDWPGWRGANRDGVSREKGLLRSWPEDGPKLLWQVQHVGVGYSSLAISGGRIFTQGDLNGVEHVIALRAEDGHVLWAVQHQKAAARVAKQVADQMKRADKNADGKLDEVEVLNSMGSNGLKADRADDGNDEAIAAARAKQFFAAVDKNNDGKITFAESGRLLERDFSNIDTKDKDADVEDLAALRTYALVRKLDLDGDFKLSREEARRSALDRLFNQIDKRPPGAKKGDELLTAEEIRAYLTKYEDGKDGRIVVAELQRYYQIRHAGRDGILTKDELSGYYGGYRNGQGDGPRGTPVVDGNRLYAEGGSGDVSCLDVASGKTIWTINLSEDLGGRRPGWGYSESPLVEGNMLIVTPGGRAGTVAALDKMTGKVLWRSIDETQGAHYASPVAADLAGVRQIVVFASRSVFGLDAKTGKKLWSSSLANNGTANCATPLVHRDHVFTASAYGTGGGLVKITASGDAQRADKIYFEKKIGNHHGGLIRIGDHLYGYGSGLICMHYLTGKIAWTDRSVGKGSLVYADGMLYVLSEGHTVGLVEATPEAYREYGRFRIERQGRPSWAHPVVAGGRLYLRDQQRLAVYDVKAK